MSEKHLTEAAWKGFAKARGYKDATLLKALATWGSAERAGHDVQADCLEALQKQAELLLKSNKGDKELTAYLAEVGKAIERSRKLLLPVAKLAAKLDAKLDAKREAKVEDRRQGDGDNGVDSGDSNEGEAPDLLTTRMVPLLRQVAKGETMQALLASNGKEVVVMLSRKPIAPARRKLLRAALAAGGSIKYFGGSCQLEASVATFVLQAEVAGLARKIRAAVLRQTGLRLKVRCRGVDGATDDDGEPDDAAGHPQAEAAGAPLDAARRGWAGARLHALGELVRLKHMLREAYGGDAGEQGALGQALQRVDTTIAALSDELDQRLGEVVSAPPDKRAMLVSAAQATLQRFAKLLRDDPVLQHIDGNELAPQTQVAKRLRDQVDGMLAALR